MICAKLHEICNDRPRYRYPLDKVALPDNGVYVLFERGEYAHGGLDRIVHVGTHNGQNRLAQRLAEHFDNANKDRSIFRKNIGRALLNKRNDPFLALWNIDLTTRNARLRYADMIDQGKLD